jgi:spore germination cell wall hydrolase CwlJ-like protein
MIKNYISAFTLGAVTLLIIMDLIGHGMVWKISTELDEVKEDVIETKEIVKEIRLITPPFSLENSYHCLASNIYWEARNQSTHGKLAVAQVTLNRVESQNYPNTICGVVTQTRYYPSGNIDLHSCQFSWYCDGKKDEPVETWGFSYDESYKLAVMFLQERPTDVTEGSTHYHSVKVEPYWSRVLNKTTQIEEHIFYK